MTNNHSKRRTLKVQQKKKITQRQQTNTPNKHMFLHHYPNQFFEPYHTLSMYLSTSSVSECVGLFWKSMCVIAEGTKHQNAGQEPSIVEYKRQQKAEPNPEAIQEAKLEPNTRTSEEETRRPKREITKPQYLKDFVEK